MRPIYVTQPHLPPLEEFIPYLEQIWQSKTLTNGGPMHQALERQLCDHLGVEHISLFANGTLALVTALQALRITGEVITTPYSFVATSHALTWNGIRPIFADIDRATMNLDPRKIEAAITPETTAIVPVHCYGTPCDTDAIQRIADDYNLKVIYDAAHAFGVCRNGQSLLKAGDLSVLSFHATKVFNTFEGGAIVSPDARTRQRIEHLKNFGFVNETTVVASGINGKMSEVNAAFGLLQLKHFDHAQRRRAEIDAIYRSRLATVPGLLLPPPPSMGTTRNYSYFPVRVTATCAISRDELFQRLKDEGIFGRRYFYPLISEFPMYRQLPSADPAGLPVAFSVSRQVICLPIYPDLPAEQAQGIADILIDAIGERGQESTVVPAATGLLASAV
jgi:dTDP-4-amino-4,6-dideoxygalactose transaminase